MCRVGNERMITLLFVVLFAFFSEKHLRNALNHLSEIICKKSATRV